MTNIQLNKLLIITLLLWGVITTSTSCSSDNDKDISAVSAIVNLSLTKYYNEKDVTVLPTWNATDEGSILLSDNGKQEISHASPIQSGSQKSLFLFTFNAAKESDVTLVGFYPSDLNITSENGIMRTNLNSSQDGTIKPFMIGKGSGKVGTTIGIQLEQLFATMYIKVDRGNYSIKKAILKGNNGENIAGDITLDVQNWVIDASENNITLDFPTPLDCSIESQTIAMMVAPSVLTKGYTVELIDTNDNKLKISSNESVKFEIGGKVYSEGSLSNNRAELVLCGSNMVYMIDTYLAIESSYKEAITWFWDAKTAASTLGLAESRCSNIDECKLIDNNQKLLVTSSYNWMVLLDVETKKILFHTTSTPNAHSAEILPNNRVAIATSTGEGANNDKVQIYDISKPNQIVYQASLTSAHGVVWNEAKQRLYAVGNNTLQIYELVDWNTASPYIKLEKTVAAPQSSLHDLTLVNSNTLCLAGKKAYLYDIGANSFAEIAHFTNSTSLKSVNYNDETKEFWYTDSTIPEGDYSWSTQTLRYVNYNSSSPVTKTIKVPDMNVYKVRVKNW